MLNVTTEQMTIEMIPIFLKYFHPFFPLLRRIQSLFLDLNFSFSLPLSLAASVLRCVPLILLSMNNHKSLLIRLLRIGFFVIRHFIRTPSDNRFRLDSQRTRWICVRRTCAFVNKPWPKESNSHTNDHNNTASDAKKRTPVV